ncbi:MAG: ABC transporter ATP-binding protein [Patescibacteria group bacterium]|jgi:putative ABC transport system ATP-binding protein
MTTSSTLKEIVTVKQLNKFFNQGLDNEVHALKEVNLEVTKGEVISIMGPSGCGKTTLLNCISGIDAATSGEVVIDGNNIQEMNDRKKTKYRASKMGFIFQTFNLIPVLSALENVEMPLLITKVSTSEARERAKAMLELVGLKDRMDHKPNELSGGQRQRVTIARALVHNPAIIWADEPTGNLDTKTANEIIDLMLQINRDRKDTFVMVTHDPAVAQKTHRTLRMDSGRVVV